MTPQEYFGTIQQSFVEVWKNHLETSKYSDHKALNDYYDDIKDAVDKLIEDFQGIYGKLGDLKNTMDTKIDDPIGYLTELKKFVKDGRKELIKEEDTEIWSDIDEVLSIIDSTLYQLKELGESKHKSLKDYLTEAMKDIYTGDHAIHEILLQMWNDKLMSKKVQNIVKKIENYLKRNSEATFEDVLDDFNDDMIDIIHLTPVLTSFNSKTVKKAKMYVLQSILHDIDDNSNLKVKDWNEKEYDIDNLKW